MNVLAHVESEMELWTVLDFKSFYCQIGALKEPQCLYIINVLEKQLGITELGFKKNEYHEVVYH